MGPFGSIMTTVGIMATLPPLLGGTLFSLLSLRSLHAHWLSFFLRTKATEGQARKHSVQKFLCKGDPGRLSSHSTAESATTGRVVECGNPNEIHFVSTGADRAKDNSAPSSTDSRISSDGREQSYELVAIPSEKDPILTTQTASQRNLFALGPTPAPGWSRHIQVYPGLTL